MLILTVLVGLVLVGVVWGEATKDTFRMWGTGGVVLTVTAGLLLVVALVFLPMERMSTRAAILRFEATRATFVASREAGRGIENAAVQLKVAEMNAWLASQQYYNGTLFDLWVPDAVDNLKPIR